MQHRHSYSSLSVGTRAPGELLLTASLGRWQEAECFRRDTGAQPVVLIVISSGADAG